MKNQKPNINEWAGRVCVCVWLSVRVFLCVSERGRWGGGRAKRSLRSIPLIIVAWQSLHKSHCWALTSWKGWFCLLSLRAQQSPLCVTCLLECQACLPLQQITMIDSDGPLRLLIAPLYTPLPSPLGMKRMEGPFFGPLVCLRTTQTWTNVYFQNKRKTYKAEAAHLVSPCPFLCSRPVFVLSSPLRCCQRSWQIHCGPTKWKKTTTHI